MSEDALAEVLAEADAQIIVRDISGGAKARYVRIYAGTLYRFEDITTRVMALLQLPLVRAEGHHTAAIWDTDAELAARIAAALRPAAAQVARPAPPAEPQQPSGGKRVRPTSVPKPRTPRGGVATK